VYGSLAICCWRELIISRILGRNWWPIVPEVHYPDRPIINNDPVWDPKPADDRLDKLDYKLLVDLDYRGCFWPLCELVDGDVQMALGMVLGYPALT
jgi:hypothetical protein